MYGRRMIFLATSPRDSNHPTFFPVREQGGTGLGELVRLGERRTSCGQWDYFRESRRGYGLLGFWNGDVAMYLSSSKST